MKGRFSDAPPLQRLDNLGSGPSPTGELLPECNVILEAATFCEHNPAATLATLMAAVREADEEAATEAAIREAAADEIVVVEPEEWYAHCSEDFTLGPASAISGGSKKRAKLSWPEFAARDAGRAVISYARRMGK